MGADTISGPDRAADELPVEAVRWRFARRDVFAGLDATHRLTLIHSLPGIVFWPVLLYALIFLFQFTVGAGYAALPTLEDHVGIIDAAFTATAAAYGVLGLVMWHRFRRYDSHCRVFAVLPLRPSDGLAALLVLIFMVGFAGRLSLSFHEFAMGDPSLTLSGGAAPEDLSNVDDFAGAGASLVTLVLLTLVAAPLVEEFLFRGWMLPMMMARGMPCGSKAMTKPSPTCRAKWREKKPTLAPISMTVVPDLI